MALPVERNEAHRASAVAGIAAAFLGAESQVPVEQEDLDLLGAVGKELEVDLGIGPREPSKHGPRQVRVEVLEGAHRVERRAAQLLDHGGMVLGLVELA